MVDLLPGGPLTDEGPLTVTHLAGLEVVIGNRYYRQRCSWCGQELVDYDVALIAVPVGQDPTPAFWPVGSLVRQAGALWTVVEPDVRDEATQTPEDACWAAYLAKPEDANPG